MTRVQQLAWEEMWPSHCKKCEGTGTGQGGGDWVDYGSTQVQLPSDPEPCPDCIENGKCPRCGEVLDCSIDDFNDWLENERPCPLCGWHHGQEPTDYRPSGDYDAPDEWLHSAYDDKYEYE